MEDNALVRLRNELEDAYDRIEQLESGSGFESLRIRAGEAEGRLARAEDENSRLQRDLDRLRETADTSQDRYSGIEKALRTERTAREEATEALAAMKLKFERAEDLLTRERQRVADTAAAGAKAVRDRQSNSAELEKYAQENAELREEIRTLNEDMNAYREAVSELKGDLEDMHEEREELEAQVRASHLREATLQRDVDHHNSSSADWQKRIDEIERTTRAANAQAQQDVLRIQNELKASQEKVAAGEKQAGALFAELRALKSQTRIPELEASVSKLTSDVQGLREQRDELSTLLEEHNEHITLLQREIKELEDTREEGIAEAVRQERRKVESASKEILGASDALKEERLRFSELTSQKADVEHLLEEARARLAAYEKGYQLEDAVKEQERLREAVRRRDADIARLTRTAGNQLDAYDMAMEIARRLADRAGLPVSTDVFKLYPELTLRKGIESAVDRLRSVNQELQAQNDALEEQRTRLLRQLRVHAEQAGGKALQYYGLKPEQLMLVNEFAENLRNGSVELPVNDRTIELQGEVKRLRERLEEAKNERDEAVTKAAATPLVQPPPAPAPAPIIIREVAVPTQASIDAAALESKHHEEMKAAVQAAADENKKLREQVDGMLSAQQRNFQQLKAGKLWGSASTAITATQEAKKAQEKAMTAEQRAANTEQERDVAIIERDEARKAAELTAAQAEHLAEQLAEARLHLDEIKTALKESKDEARSANASMREATKMSAAAQARAAAAVAAAASAAEHHHPPSRFIQSDDQAQGRISSSSASNSAPFGPKSPAGKAIIRRSEPEGAPMAPLEWAAEVTDARAALVEALEELALREDEAKRSERIVKEHSEKLASMVSQQTALYREYISERAMWERDLKEAKTQAEEANIRADAADAKARRFDEVVASLDIAGGSISESSSSFSSSSAEDGKSAAEALTYVAGLSAVGGSSVPTIADINELKAFVKALARKVASFEVSQPTLMRRFNLAKQEAAAARAGQRSAELATVESDAHYRQRILYLELWKKGAESRLERLTEVEEQWVPGDEHRRSIQQLQDVQARYADLLASEGELRVQLGELRGLPTALATEKHKLATLTADLERVTGLLTVARDEVSRVRGLLNPSSLSSSSNTLDQSQSQKGGVGGSSDPISIANSASSLQTATRSELVACVSKQRTISSELEVAVAAAEKRSQIESERAAELETMLISLQERSLRTEESLEQVKKSLSSAHSSKAEIENKLASLSTSSSNGKVLSDVEVAALQETTKTYKDEINALKIELHKAREVADIASDQASAVTGLAKDRETEIETLKESVRILSSRSDDDAIIGSLQFQLLSLKTSFHAVIRKQDGLRHSLQRSRVASSALEVVVDQRAGEVLAVREDARVKQLALQRLVDEMRGNLRAIESGSGVSLQQAQTFNASVKRLHTASERHAQELETALRARHAAEEESEARMITIMSLQRTVHDLRAAAAGGGGESRDVFKRLVDLNDQLRTAQLSALRHRRELAAIKDEARLKSKRADESEAHIRGLEERLVAQLTDSRKREDEQRRQLHSAVMHARTEAGDIRSIARAASTEGLTVESAAAEEASATKSEIDALTRSVKEAEKRSRDARERAETAVEKARLRKRRITFLEKQLEIHGVDIATLRSGEDAEDAAEKDEEEGDEGDTNSSSSLFKPEKNASGMAKMKEHYEAEARRLQKAAQATHAQLKDMLDKKNLTIRDYQEKFEVLRRERDAERTRELGEREKIAQAAYEENKLTIERLRAAVRDLQTSPANSSSALVNQQLVDRSEALEHALFERDRRIEELQAQVNHLSSSLNGADARLQRQASEALSGSSVQELKTELDKATKRALEAEQSLKDSNSLRDRKLRTLQASFAALKEQFVRAEEEHAEAVTQLQASLSKGTSMSSALSSAAIPTSSLNESQKSSTNNNTSNADILDAGMREKVSALAEQVQRFAKEVKALRAKEQEDAQERQGLLTELEEMRDKMQTQKDEAKASEAAVTKARTEISRMQKELKNAQIEQQHAVAEALSQGGGVGGGNRSETSNADILSLQKKIKVLEAQNVALRSAQAEAREASSSDPSHLDASQLQTMITAAAAAQAKAQMMTSSSSSNRVSFSGGPTTTSLDIDLPSSSLRGGGGDRDIALGNDSPADLRLAWEEQRKLRKKVEALQTKLNERTKEAEIAKSNEGATLSSLAKYKSERDALEKRLGALVKKQQNLDAATVAALNEIEPVAVLKGRIFHLEEENDELRAKADGELTSLVNKLRAENEAANIATRTAQAEASDARVRLHQLQKVLGGDTVEGGAPVVSLKSTALRAEEDRYLAEATLRDRLAEARRQVASLEGTLLSRDAAAMELRFELEASKQTSERLQKRVAEVTAFATIATRGKPLSEAAAHGVAFNGGASALVKGGQTHNGGASGGAELEEVTVALKRVAEKQRAEIERLRKQLAATNKAKDVASEAAASFAKAAAASAASSAANAAALGAHPPPIPGTSSSSSSSSIALQEEKYNDTARALKQAKAEVKLLKDRIVALETPLPGSSVSYSSNNNAASSSSSSSDRASATKLAAAESEVRRLDSEAKKAIAETKALKTRCEMLEKSLRETGNAKQIPPALPSTTSTIEQSASSTKSILTSSSTSLSNTITSKQAQADKDNISAAAALSSTSTMAERAKSRITSTSQPEQQQQQLDQERSQQQSMALSKTSSTTNNDIGNKDRDSRISQLEKENAELRSELSAFDLDFFEEIEDLKFKYAEAAKKCRAFDEYVRINPPRH
jgi:chromosome segregation ATPase